MSGSHGRFNRCWSCARPCVSAECYACTQNFVAERKRREQRAASPARRSDMPVVQHFLSTLQAGPASGEIHNFFQGGLS